MKIKKTNMEEVVFKKYEDLTDSDLVTLARLKDQDAILRLFERYKKTIIFKANKYYAPGLDRDDLIQEGNIGLYNSINDYNPENLVKASFKVFCEICVERQMITAVKTAKRQKHNPLNSSISVDKPMYEDDSDRTLNEVLEKETDLSPEDLMIDKENILEILTKLKDRLSSFESQVLEGQLMRLSYQEIADMLGRGVKSIDNAMQRIREKLQKIVTEMKNQDYCN